MYASACIKGRSAGVQNKNPCLQKQTGVFNILSTVSTMILHHTAHAAAHWWHACTAFFILWIIGKYTLCC